MSAPEQYRPARVHHTHRARTAQPRGPSSPSTASGTRNTNWRAPHRHDRGNPGFASHRPCLPAWNTRLSYTSQAPESPRPSSEGTTGTPSSRCSQPSPRGRSLKLDQTRKAAHPLAQERRWKDGGRTNQALAGEHSHLTRSGRPHIHSLGSVGGRTEAGRTKP